MTFAAIVSAVDAFGNVVSNYTGTVAFASSDPQAILPANYSYSPAEGGKHTFGSALERVHPRVGTFVRRVHAWAVTRLAAQTPSICVSSSACMFCLPRFGR